MAEEGVKDLILKLQAAADEQQEKRPDQNLIAILNALAKRPAKEHPDIVTSVAAMLSKLNSPTGAGVLATWLGARVEGGNEPEPTCAPVLETFLRWSRSIETVSGDAGEDDPEPDPRTIDGLEYLGSALVTHLAHSRDQSGQIHVSDELRAEVERIEHLSNGATWVLQLLNQTSGDLVVLIVDQRLGFVVRYENLSNCFHLFTLLQGALAKVKPNGCQLSKEKLAIARGEIKSGQGSDQAWWHYGQPTSPEPNIVASVWGEMSPDQFIALEGTRVMLLWPPLLGQRSWSIGFFSPILDVALPRVTLTKELTPDEVAQWWTKLDLPQPRPWWRFW